MKILKCSICWLCLIVLCVYAFPLRNQVSAESYYMGGTTWYVEDGCVTITGTGSIADYTCPWGIDKQSITEIIIEDGVTGIGKGVFQGFNALTKVTIGKSLKYIDQSAFDGCTRLKSVYITDLASWCSINFNSNPLSNGADLYIDGQLVTDLVIPEGCEEISPYAFVGCRSIKTVHFSKGVKDIQKYAFFRCANLKSISLPGSLDIIRYNSFGQCPQLRTVEYRGSLRQMKKLQTDAAFGDSSKVVIWQMSIGYTLLFATITQFVSVGIPVGIVFLILFIRRKRRGY